MASSSLSRQLAAWRKVRGRAGDRELRFCETLGDEQASLYQLALSLVEAERFDEACAVCLDALDGPVRYEEHWRSVLMFALVRAERWAEASAQLPMALAIVPLYSAERVMVAWITILEQAGATAEAIAVFRVAKKEVVAFTSAARTLGLKTEHLKNRGSTRLRLAQLFAEIVEPSVELEALPDEQLWTCLANAQAFGATALAARCEVLRMPRRAKTVRVAAAVPDAVISALLALSPPVKRQKFDQALALLATLDEQPRMELLNWAYAAIGEARDRSLALYRALAGLSAPHDEELREDWLSSLNNAIIMTWKWKDFELSRALVEAAASHAHENPGIFHAAACTFVSLGELDEAFEQVKLAIRHGYDGVTAMRDDEDLNPLRQRRDFKDLFLRRRK